MGRRESKDYTLYQTFHQRPIVEGLSGRTPPEAYQYIDGNPLLARWRNQQPLDCGALSAQAIDGALQQLLNDGFRYVIVHHDWRSVSRGVCRLFHRSAALCRRSAVALRTIRSPNGRLCCRVTHRSWLSVSPIWYNHPMLMNNAIISRSFFLHLLATVAWIGGLVTLALVVQPVLNRTVTDVQERARLLEAMLKRFQPIANLSLVVLILTGMVQTFTNRFYKGFLRFDNAWAQAIFFKHLAVLGMIIVAGFITFSVQPALKRNALLIANGAGRRSAESRACNDSRCA